VVTTHGPETIITTFGVTYILVPKLIVTRFILFIGFFFFTSLQLSAQSPNVRGKISGELDSVVAKANILINNEVVAVSNDSGYFELTVPVGEDITIKFTHASFEPSERLIRVKPGEVKTVRVEMNTKQLTEYRVIDDGNRNTFMISMDPSIISVIATPGDPVMNMVKSAGLGVATNNELSSGYSVRGGNFDENLIYVNDVEIYRPFLARSGQQEGLSFINSDMVQGINFSSGGFEARYGDKMSSVLDITYRKPNKFSATAMGSFLGVNLHIEDAIFKNRLKYSIGGRYKSNNYILSGLDTKGEYQPNFFDLQGVITYDVSEKFEISILGGYSDNNYQMIPSTRTTIFGHVQEAKQLTVYFDGKESTRFKVGNAAVTFAYKPNYNSSHKLIASFYNTQETENFDVTGQYYLGDIESDLANPDFGQVVNTVGVGTFMNHARNKLQASVYNVETKSKIFRAGKHFGGKNSMTFAFGIRYQHEEIQDKLDEWNILDSSGYMLPYYGTLDTGAMVFEDVLKSKISLSSNRFMAYYQQGFTWYTKTNHRISLTAGVRAQYWDLNGEFIASPRVQFAWKPNWKPDILFRVAGGVYYQAPFYRELRRLDGTINTNVKAQQSIHAIIGVDYNFKIWNRPFKFITEAYFKWINNLNPYEIDNIRIRYYAMNQAHGFSTGVDMKLGGEFIEGLQSWLTASVMTSVEDLENDSYTPPGGGATTYPGYIPRPTDQRLQFSLFFQDHIPKVKSLRVHVNLLLGSMLPFGPPNDNRYSDTLRAPFYRRVDIGFSYVILQPNREIKKPKSFFSYFTTMWVSFEVFNLLDINNTISYLWVRDINSRQYAVPNYLTPRLFNLKLQCKFGAPPKHTEPVKQK
jgi:hypothetical protein